jgi:catechol 2,3-dioxygenase-like lactoylglutathione lyase family enzyme
MPTSPGPDLSALASATSRLPSLRIAEIVLQTNQFAALKSWYSAVLGRAWDIENDPKRAAAIAGEHGDGGKQVHASRVRSCFMILDKDAAAAPYGQLFALFEIAGVGTEPTKDPGLNHMQFKHANMADLVTRIELLRDAGIVPHRSANHGPITSFYYRDPDRNVVELCSNNFETFDEWLAFFDSDQFKANPSGIDIDMAEFLGRYHSGLQLADLVRIPA